MRTITSWTDTPDTGEGGEAGSSRCVVWDMVFKPGEFHIQTRFFCNSSSKFHPKDVSADGSALVVGYGRFLLIYDAATGEVVRNKELGGEAYALSASWDGAYVAVGGTDRTVSVLDFDLNAKFTFTHGESIQALAFNPVAHNVLASCSAVDFAIWSMPSPQLRKIKVPAKILCAAWTNDGQYLAIGMLNGVISIRDTTGAEKMTITRSAPIWDLAFAPPRVAPAGASSAAVAAAAADDGVEMMAVACWDGTVSFYSLAGEKLHKERQLGYDPCSVRYFSSGEYFVVSGSDKKATLFTRDGVKLSTVADGKDWLWRAVPRPKTNFVAVGSNDGTISMHTVVFSTVHGLYQDRYAFRDAMTDVVVQHLVTEQRVRIKCRDYVKKIAVYRDRLAVQLPDRIIIYEITPQGTAGSPGSSPSSPSPDAETSMAYKVKDRIYAALDCNLLVVTSSHVILCQEKKLQLYSCSGVKEREWVLEAVIRYIKVVGGPAGKEGLLVGLKNGAVLRVFVDNPFPQPVVKHGSAIRCLDLSMSRRKLAVVDELSTCTVYDSVTKDVLFAEAGANSVAWNTEMENMLCFSGNGSLSIKTGTFPLHTQKMQGFVVGFNGSKIFCLQSIAMQTIDVPQSASLYRYIEARDWDMAYRVACLGVTDSDWRTLGEAALKALQLHIARSAFVRLADMRYLELINYMDNARKVRPGDVDDSAVQSTLLAEVAAYAGRYVEAGKLHLKGGSVEKAIELFSDLRLWSEARKFAEESGGRVDVSSLMLKQASWCEETGDAKAAATIYSAVGQAHRAVQILGERGLHTQLTELVRTFNPSGDGGAASFTKDVRDALHAAGDYFRRANLPRFARECYVKLGDTKSLLQLHIDSGQFAEALALAEQQLTEANAHGDDSARAAARKLLSFAHLAYGEWLAAEDRMEEAQRQYEVAGRPDLAARILEHLAFAALVENRYADAGAFYTRLALDCVHSLELAAADRVDLLRARYATYANLGRLYLAYDTVYAFCTMPFTSAPADAVLNAARFVINACAGIVPNNAMSTAVSTRGATFAIPYKVSISTCLYAVARQAMGLQCYKLARFAIDKLSERLVPRPWSELLEVAALQVATKPFSDRDELVPVCYRCGAANPGLTATPSSLMAVPSPAPRLPPRLTLDKVSAGDAADASSLHYLSCGAAGRVDSGDVCSTCGHAFVRSLISYEVLPLVEFVPESLGSEEALRVLQMGSHSADAAVVPPTAIDSLQQTGNQQILSFGPAFAQPAAASASSSESAFRSLLAIDVLSRQPVVSVPQNVLAKINPATVFIIRTRPARLEEHTDNSRGVAEDITLHPSEKYLPPRFYKNVLPEVPLQQCATCQGIFSAEDWETTLLSTGRCPLCHAKDE